MKIHQIDSSYFQDVYGGLPARIRKMLDQIIAKGITTGLRKVQDRNKDLIAFAVADMAQREMESTSVAYRSLRDQAFQSLDLYLQCAYNIIRLTTSQNATETLPLDGKMVEFPTNKAEGSVGVNEWLDYYHFALAGRAEEALNLLSAYPIDLLKNSTYKAEEYAWSYIAFLRTVGKSNSLELLEQAEKQLDSATFSRKDWREQIIRPQLNLWKTVWAGNEKEFNEALESGVQNHQKYWNQKVDDNGGSSYRNHDQAGYYSTRLTAIAAYAHDQGMEVTYESDYLPRFLVVGNPSVDAKLTLPG